MVVQYCQTYTDREHGKILTYDLYSSYGSWKGFKPVFHFNRIVAKRGVFYCVHIISSAWVFTKQWNTVRFATIRLKWKLALRIVRTVRTKNDFMDRTNRTVCEKDLRIVNRAFQSVKESGCLRVKWSLENSSIRTDRTNWKWLHRSCEPYWYINIIYILYP